jgi:hypothetical protein
MSSVEIPPAQARDKVQIWPLSKSVLIHGGRVLSLIEDECFLEKQPLFLCASMTICWSLGCKVPTRVVSVNLSVILEAGECQIYRFHRSSETFQSSQVYVIEYAKSSKVWIRTKADLLM